MKILVASDKFKGSMSASEACDAIRIGIESSCGDCEIRCVPIADGGDGMASAITSARSGEWKKVEVQDPFGKPISAGFGLIDDGLTAVIEMAEASGLWRVDGCNDDAYAASTFGTGQLICSAAELGVENIVLGIGGSATNDGGAGMAQALGYSFIGKDGKAVCEIPNDLIAVESINDRDCIKLPKVTVACDVTNPLLGTNGCTQVYGPQKGILPVDFSRHEERLEHLVRLLGEDGSKAAEASGAGAAGGLGFGCLFFLKAKLTSGFDLISDILNLNEQVSWADYVVTGEGKIDTQSLQGKAPVGVAEIAKRLGKKTTAFCGIRGEGDFSAYFDRVIELDRGERNIKQSMKDGFELLKTEAARSF